MRCLNQRIFLVFLLIISCLSLEGFAQSTNSDFSCNDSFSESVIDEFIQSISNSNSSRNARVNTSQYRVAVRATVFHESSLAENDLTTDDVKSLVAHANTYFKNINVELFLQNNTVNHVADREYINFRTNQETDLRAKYDVTNAINVYFFKTIVTEDDVFLNGSAALPNLSTNSNRIFLSYLDRNKEDFETLKSKVFLHELGHYFGLLHTFQNSNNSDLSKRELVSRDVGTIGNCNVTGDYLCDTPADPFERLVSISSYNCNQRLPDGLVDALGYPYAPPIDNIMSYHVRCGNVFTVGQYQRMEQSFVVRFSPNASYDILENQANYLVVNSVSSAEICEGETVRVKFTPYGDFGRTDNFILQISDSSGDNFTELSNARIVGTNEFSVKLDNIPQASSSYRFRVVSKIPYLESTVSQQFTIHKKGELSISLANESIRPGSTSTLFLNFTGSGPWEVVFENGITLSSVNNRNHQIRLKPLATSTYRVISATGRCGAVNVKNNVTLTIAEPAIVFKPEFEKKSCEKTFFQIPVSGLNSSDNAASYRVRLSNANTTITLQSSLSSGTLFALAPVYLPNALNEYKLTIEGSSVEEYSVPTTFTVLPRAGIPTAASSVTYCFNSVAKALTANGTKLKWYFGQTDLAARDQIIPPTGQAGVSYYYVTQTNEFGCESVRREIQVVVKKPATAEISGDNTIKFGDKTSLAIKLKGEAPWNFELSDGQRFETKEAEVFPEVQPNQSKVYTLSKAINTCGEVFLTGSASITVLQPLAIKSEFIEELSVFPNPVADVLNLKVNEANFKSFPLTIQLFDMMGKTVMKRLVERGEIQQTFSINVESIPAGLYTIQLKNTEKVYNKRLSIIR